jgi:hypothetical protein
LAGGGLDAPVADAKLCDGGALHAGADYTERC